MFRRSYMLSVVTVEPQTANVAHFQRKIRLSGYSAYPDRKPSQLIRPFPVPILNLCEHFVTWYAWRRGIVSTSPNPQAGGLHRVGCSRLLIQYIRSYLLYWRPFLLPQAEDAPCHGDRDPLTFSRMFVLPAPVVHYLLLSAKFKHGCNVLIHSQNCKKRLLASSCLSVRLSAWNNSAPTGRIFENILEYFSKIHRENSRFIQIWQE